MTTFDPEATIERAKMHIYDKVEDADWGNAYDAARAAISTIAADVLAPIEAVIANPPTGNADPFALAGFALIKIDEVREAIADIKAKAGAR